MDTSGWMLSLVAVVGAVSLVACGDPVESGGNEGLNVGEQHDVDVEFVLENETGAPIYIQQATFPSPGWLSVLRGDEHLYINEDICFLPRRCDEEYGVDCDMAPPHLEPLDSGEQLRTSWGGTEYVTVQEDGDRCYEATSVDPHEMLEAEFCYGLASDVESAQGRLEEPTCETIEFQPTSADELVVTAETGEPPPSEDAIDFVVENQADTTIYVQRGTIPKPGWLSVVRSIMAAQKEVLVTEDCGLPCPCDDDQACADCGDVEAVAEPVEPGEQHRWTWEGDEFVVTGSEDDSGEVCYETTSIEYELLGAELCYGFEVDETTGGQYVENERCEGREFHFGVDEEVVVEAGP